MFIWLRSFLFKQTALSELWAIQRLNPYVQRHIAMAAAGPINLARAEGATALAAFYAVALRARHDAIRDGARSQSDTEWAQAALRESWGAAQLGKAQGTLNRAEADGVIREIEKFVFDPQREGENG
jgi:hypothetical protein